MSTNARPVMADFKETSDVVRTEVTDEALARVARAPTTFPAWVLRAVAQELQARRAAATHGTEDGS